MYHVGIERIYESNLVKLGEYVWSVEKKSEAINSETSGHCGGQASEHNHILLEFIASIVLGDSLLWVREDQKQYIFVFFKKH